MTDDNIKKNSIEDKLSTIKYNCDSRTHLIVDNTICRVCTNRECTYICPAKVYTYDEDQNIINVEYENCLECGACRVACPLGAIDWKYPKAKYGVIYKYS